MNRFNVYFLMMCIFYACSCEIEKKAELSFKQKIIDIMSKGTDSTKEFIFIDDGHLIDSNRAPEIGTMIQTKTLLKNKFLIYTSFESVSDTIKGTKVSSLRYIESKKQLLNNEDYNELFGHYFDFKNNFYSWHVGDGYNANYIVEFDSLGRILTEQGTIRVGYVEVGELEREVFFTTVFHEIDSVIIKSNSSVNSFKIFKDSYWQPLTKTITIKKGSDSIIYLEIYGKEKYDGKAMQQFDTVNLNQW